MDIVVRGKNRPVSSRLDAVAREKVATHRQVHPRRRAGRGRLRRAAAPPRRRVAAVRDHRPPQEALREGARVRVRTRGRARPRGRQGRAPGRAHQGEAREPFAPTSARNGATATARDNGDGRRRAIGDADDELEDDDDVGRARSSSTKQFTAKPMDPGEAALQMQLLGHDFYLFTNSRDRPRRGALPPPRRRPRADRDRPA